MEVKPVKKECIECYSDNNTFEIKLDTITFVLCDSCQLELVQKLQYEDCREE